MSTAVKHKQTWILYSEGVKHGPQYKTGTASTRQASPSWSCGRPQWVLQVTRCEGWPLCKKPWVDAVLPPTFLWKNWRKILAEESKVLKGTYISKPYWLKSLATFLPHLLRSPNLFDVVTTDGSNYLDYNFKGLMFYSLEESPKMALLSDCSHHHTVYYIPEPTETEIVYALTTFTHSLHPKPPTPHRHNHQSPLCLKYTCYILLL